MILEILGCISYFWKIDEVFADIHVILQIYRDLGIVCDKHVKKN